MQVVELSNHPSDMLHDVTLRRRAADRRAQDRYEDALIRHQAAVQAIRVKRDRARRQRQWLTWLRLALAVASQKRRAPRTPPPSKNGTDAEEKIRAGIAGEQQVATELSRALADDWTLLRGYRNRRGEIDHLLLGPQGPFAQPAAQRASRRPGAVPARARPAGHRPACGHPHPPPLPPRPHQKPHQKPHRKRRHLDRPPPDPRPRRTRRTRRPAARRANRTPARRDRPPHPPRPRLPRANTAPADPAPLS